MRVKAAPDLSIAQEPGRSGLPPCFFIVRPKAVNVPSIDSGSVDDCLSLLPNGHRLDVFEIPLEGGFLPIKTDLYVPDIIPLAFTRTYVPLTVWSEQFQVFLPHVYDPFLTGSRFPYTYQYDMQNRLLGVQNSSEDVAMEIAYDSIGAIAAITMDREHAYHFRYAVDRAFKTLDAFVTDPGGRVTHVRMRSQEGQLVYSIQK